MFPTVLWPFSMSAENQYSKVKGLYIHVPFCDGKCFYCAFYSIRYDSSLACRYLTAVKSERDGYPRLDVETVYVGGGTPSILSISELRNLCGLITENVFIGRLKEWSVEVNPGSITEEKLAVMAGAGVNRISLGAQSFDGSILKWLGRRHDVAAIHEAVRMIKAAGLNNFGLDLIACIPGFKPGKWLETLDKAVALEPAHVSVYALTNEEGSRLAGAVAGGEVGPLADDEQLEALAQAASVLKRAGYRRYEISNYARPGFECLHNLSCWRGGEYIGLGPAASSHVDLRRWTNSADLSAYLGAIEAGNPPPGIIDLLTEKLKRIEVVVFGLRTADGVSLEKASCCQEPLLVMQQGGLVICKNGYWRLTERGMNLADYVGAELLTSGNAE